MCGRADVLMMLPLAASAACAWVGGGSGGGHLVGQQVVQLLKISWAAAIGSSCRLLWAACSGMHGCRSKWPACWLGSKAGGVAKCMLVEFCRFAWVLLLLLFGSYRLLLFMGFAGCMGAAAPFVWKLQVAGSWDRCCRSLTGISWIDGQGERERERERKCGLGVCFDAVP